MTGHDTYFPYPSFPLFPSFPQYAPGRGFTFADRWEMTKTRNELFEEISALTDAGSVPYVITPQTRNGLLNEWVVLLGGDSKIGLTRNEYLESALALLSLPSGSDFSNDFNNDFGGQ